MHGTASHGKHAVSERSTYKGTYPIKDKGPKACPRHGCALICVLSKSGFPKSVWSM